MLAAPTLKVEQIRELEEDSPIQNLAGQRVAPLVEDKVDVAERMVDQVESDVRAELVSLGVVLQESVQERAARERVEDLQSNQRRDKVSGGHRDIVSAECRLELPVVVRLEGDIPADGPSGPVPEIAPVVADPAAEFAAAIGVVGNRVIAELVVVERNVVAEKFVALESLARIEVQGCSVDKVDTKVDAVFPRLDLAGDALIEIVVVPV